MTATKGATAFASLIIRAGVIERIYLEPRGTHGASHTRELIGDWFSRAFTVRGSSEERRVFGFADDKYMFKLDTLAPNVLLDDSVYPGGWPIFGPLVIQGAVIPDTVAMTELELSAFHIGPPRGCHVQEREFTLPTLIFRPGYDV